MNHHVVFAIIAAQVLVFQFLATGWVRAMLAFRLGLRDLPTGAADAVAAHDRRATRAARALGALLLLAAAALALLPGPSHAQRKVGLTFVSLASSAGLLVQLLVEQRALRALAALLPPPAMRSASLEPRRLDRYYPAWLESAPWLAFAVTVSFTILAVRRMLPGLPAELAAVAESVELWLAPLAQLLFAGMGALAARSVLHGRPLISQQSRSSLGDPAVAIRLEETLRRIKLRGLLGVRLTIVLMFALMQARRIYAPGDHGGLLAAAVWGLVAVMLGLFAVLMLRVAGLRKGASS